MGDDTCDEFRYREEVVQDLRGSLPEAESLDEARDFFSALSGRTRLLILYCLCRTEEMCVCDLAGALDLELSTVSHQLRRLRNAGLVTYRRDGKMAFYRMADDKAAALVQSRLGKETEQEE